jgi:hypothetical protein
MSRALSVCVLSRASRPRGAVGCLLFFTYIYCISVLDTNRLIPYLLVYYLLPDRLLPPVWADWLFIFPSQPYSVYAADSLVNSNPLTHTYSRRGYFLPVTRQSGICLVFGPHIQSIEGSGSIVKSGCQALTCLLHAHGLPAGARHQARPAQEKGGTGI